MARKPERKTSRRIAPQAKPAHRTKGAKTPVRQRSSRDQQVATISCDGVPIKGVTRIAFTSDRVRLRLAEQRRAAAQLISVMDRRGRLQRLVEDAASAAQRYPGLDLHISEWPPELIGTMPQPAGTRADIPGCHAHVGVVEWFSPGREVRRTIRSRSSQTDELTLGFGELQSLLPRLSDVVCTAPVEAYVDPVNWWLLKLHTWVKPPLSVWAGGAEFAHGSDRAGAENRCLVSSVGNVFAAVRSATEQMTQGVTAPIWRDLDLVPPHIPDKPIAAYVVTEPVSMAELMRRLHGRWTETKLRLILDKQIFAQRVSERQCVYWVPGSLLKSEYR